MDENTLLQAIERMIESKLETVKTDITQMMSDNFAAEREITKQMIEDSANGIRTLIETDVDKRINLLVEGHASLAEKLNRLEDLPERIEDIQNTVSVLKSVFLEHIRE